MKTALKEISRAVQVALTGWPETARLIVILLCAAVAWILIARLT